MPFMQAPNSRSRQNSNPNGQGTPPAGPQPHPQMPQRVTGAPQSPLSEVCPPKHSKGKGCARSRAKTSNAKGVEPETPFRTPTRRKRATRIGDMQKAADNPRRPRKRPRTRKAARPRGGRRPFFFAKTQDTPANERGGPLRVPLPQVPLPRLPALSPRNAPRGPAAP